VLFTALLKVREGSTLNERAPAACSTPTPRAPKAFYSPVGMGRGE
jgi:hypothetical protein